MSELVLRRVSVSLSGTRIVQPIDATLQGGRLIGLIGPNGAGKTTLLRAIAQLTPYEGEVFSNGFDLASLPMKRRAKEIAYLPQAAEVAWPLDAFHVAALGRLPHLSPYQEMGDGDLQAIERAMETCDVTEFRDRPVHDLSGGERARVMLARAFAIEAPILLADEPVASLDPYHQLQVMEVLKTQAASGNLVVVVMHDLSLAARFCDELLLLSDGALLVSGAPDDVLSDAHLEAAYKVTSLRGERDGQKFILPWSTLPR